MGYFRSYIILWKYCVFMILASIQMFIKKGSINECARMFLLLKWSYMILNDLWFLHSWKYLKRGGVRQKIYCRKRWFWNFKIHMCPLITSEVILHNIKKLCLQNIIMRSNHYLNRFINQYARKKKAKISESQGFFSEV